MYRIRRHVTFSFRILGLSLPKIELFKHQVKSAKRIRVARLRDDPKVSTLRFPLRKHSRHDDLIQFLKTQKIRKSSYGIWASIASNNDTGGIHVPPHIQRLYERTGGNLDFSYTWLKDEE